MPREASGDAFTFVGREELLSYAEIERAGPPGTVPNAEISYPGG